tara:strand:- start:1609 stop:1857 length:249 start_codon:yes stop_codon:yes gene_type:complete
LRLKENKMSKIIGIIVIAFFLIGGYMIYDGFGDDLDTTEGKLTLVKETGKWLFNVGRSTKNTVGYAIEQDWLPDVNETNSSK